MTKLYRFPPAKAGMCRIPSSATAISYGALSDCNGLSAITVSPANPAFKDLDGVLFDASGTTLLQYPGGRTGPYTLPTDVTEISYGAFHGCAHLTHITIAPRVRSLSLSSTFSGCSGLSEVDAPSESFLGSPYFPGLPLSPFFPSPSASFTVYLQGSSGFTSPSWRGLSAVEIDTTTHPAAPWLLAHDLRCETDHHQDPNGDGVDLLPAYALDLDPRAALSGLPRPVLGSGTLGIEYFGIAPRVTYTVETSPDLVNWATEGVTLTDPNPDGMRTATVDSSTARRFIRLVVKEASASP